MCEQFVVLSYVFADQLLKVFQAFETVMLDQLPVQEPKPYLDLVHPRTVDRNKVEPDRVRKISEELYP